MTFVNNLKGYEVVLKRSAQKDLEKVPKQTAYTIEAKLEQLAAGVNNLDVLKLTGYIEPKYRLRVGDYRVIFEIHEREIIILVIEITHRKDAYK